MASQDSNVEVFNVRLYEDDDDAENRAYKDVLNALINQSVAPSQAAAHIDSWIVREANTRLSHLKERDPPFVLSPEEENEGLSLYQIGPNASRHIDMVFDTIASICSAFPPAHPAQDSLIEFLIELKSMPKHEVPNLSYSDDSGELVFDQTLVLWQFGTDELLHLAERFLRESEELSYPFSDVESLGSEVQLRWRNFQAFVARLTTSELIDCSFLCALGLILPSSQVYPDLEERKIGGPHRITGDLIAGSQWLAAERERRWVYAQCKKADEVYGVRDMWSLQRWDQWKQQLEFIVEDERFLEEAHLVAQSLREKMIAQEAESSM